MSPCAVAARLSDEESAPPSKGQERFGLRAPWGGIDAEL
jgi:hypothetical protein